MAVYKQNYKGYSGPRASGARRWLVPFRYGQTRLFHSKLLAIFLGVCTFYPIVCVAYMYLLNHTLLLMTLGIPLRQLMAIDGKFFYFFCVVQGGLALLLAAVVGPGLLSPDMVNGALALYLSRPISRLEYVAGKLGVLLLLLSLITWIPGLAIFAVYGSIAGWSWCWTNLYLCESLLVGLVAWIVTVSLISLAVTAVVKWRISASAMILAVFFAGAGFGAAINDVMRTSYGTLIDLSGAARILWADLLGYDAGAVLPSGDAWIVLIGVCLLCAFLLARRIRAFEVIR